MRKLILNQNVTIDLPQGPIGISCSGGADSSLLLYVLMKNHQDDIHIFTCASSLKGRTNAIVVSRVVEKCIQLTGKLNVFCHTWYVEEQNNINLFGPQKEYLKKGQIVTLYSAVTANPPAEISYTFHKDAHEQTVRDPRVKRSTWDSDKLVHVPFTNIDKSEIASLYNELGIIDELFPLTRSCETPKSEFFQSHCNECWWCGERKWAFGRLG